jgi:hypothetical protein
MQPESVLTGAVSTVESFVKARKKSVSIRGVASMLMHW